MLARRALLAAGTGLVWLPLAGCGSAPVQGFASLAAARQAIDALLASPGWRSTGSFNLPQTLNHLAQSVEYSMRGFPQAKPALFQATVGAAAFAFFDARGAMRHSLAEAIPGAPPLPAEDKLPAAAARLQAALLEFEGHLGGLAPHFAYGPLDKLQYTRAHLMHLANHWTELVRA